MRKILPLMAALACVMALSACDRTKEQLGLTQTAPDEYAVIRRAPLEMPPDYTLRPPQPGTARPQEANPDKQAKSVVFGDSKGASDKKPDDGEAALLQQAGADKAQPNIRQQVDYETSVLAPKEKPVAERLLGWTMGGDKQPPATVVDPKAEAERLKKNEEEGKPVTDGETPTIEQ